jgi:predicted Fe-Mo cluster-binding NifX family protein
MTRFAMPVISSRGVTSKVNEHFARSEYFAIFEANGEQISSVKVLRFAPEDDKKKAEFLADKGAEIVLAGRIGACMTRILIDRGIKIFSGAEGTIKEAYGAYVTGKLTEAKPNPYQL